MPGRNLTIADGQLATTAAQIASSPGDDAARVNVTLSNTGTQDETVTLTLSRNGGTARRVRRIVLGPNEFCDVNGLALNRTDSLLAVTTNAGAVDYVVSIAPENAPNTFNVFDAYGQLKTVPYLTEQLLDSLG